MSSDYTHGSIGWFINKVLLDELNRVITKDGYHYVGFSLVSVGIEFLGACYKNDFGDTNTGDKFIKAIENLFDPGKYQGLEETLYVNLRCGMAHVLRPQSKKKTKRGKEIIPVVLSDRSHFADPKAVHLSHNKQGALILVSEDFYYDFEAACKKLVQMMESNESGIANLLGKPYLLIS